MFTLRYNSIATLFVAHSVMICASATAYDASVSDFEWHYPQTLTPETGGVQYSYRVLLSPSAYPFDCYYNTQLYLSRDRAFSDDDFALFGPVDTLVSAGAVGFSATATRWLYGHSLLPATGTYYIFLEVTPGLGAPPDTNGSNNAAMAPNPIRVENGTTPPPSAQPALTAATVVTAAPTGQSIVVTGYSDGGLEFRDWQGNILATRDGLGQVTALAAGVLGSPPLPRLFAASADSGGALRMVDLTRIGGDLVSRTNLGRVTAIEVCGGPAGAVYVGTDHIGGTLRKLDGRTLLDENVRGTMGEISDIIQVHGERRDVLAVGTDKAGGSVYFLDKDTLNDVVARRRGLGRIYALSSADMDRDGRAELIIASDADGGSIRLREGPSFASDLAVRTDLGEIYTLDYGSLGAEPCAEPAGSAWVLFASKPKGGSLGLLHVDIGASVATFQDWASRRDLGPVRYAELHDFYAVDTALAGAVWENDVGPALHVLDEDLIDPGTAPVTTEDFETGDFSRFPWERSGDADWAVALHERNAGLFSAQAGPIGHNDSTTLQVRLQCVSGDITFYRRVSCEPDYDRLRFTIDGVQKGTWSGEADWEEVSSPVTAGIRTFKWTYSKDSSVSRGDDTAWIDDIVFPIGGGSVATFSAAGPEEQPPYQLDIQYEFDK